MSLWLQSLEWCLAEAKSPKDRAKCFYEHFRMPVGRALLERGELGELLEEYHKTLAMVVDEINILDGEDAMLPPYSPLCTFCKHQLGFRHCKAFDKIPADIWRGENKHTKPIKGQSNQIVFEKNK